VGPGRRGSRFFAQNAATFADHAPYLARTQRGTARANRGFTDFGPELSRGFRALSVWFTMKTYGLDRFGELIAQQCCDGRERWAERIAATPQNSNCLAPVTLNNRVFPLRGPFGRCGERRAQRQDRDRPARTRHRGPIHDAHKRQTRNSPKRDEPPHNKRPDLDARSNAVLAAGAGLLDRSPRSAR